MQEVFYEECATIVNEKSATLKYNLLKFLSIMSYFCVFVWVILIYFAYPLNNFSIIDVIFIIFPIIVFVASGIFLGKFKNKTYIEYDYTFISGSIRIAQVFKNIKRKFLTKFDCKDIEKLGKYDSELYRKYSIMPNVNKMILTSNNTANHNKDFYYMVVNADAEKKLLIFECTQTFIVNVIKFTNKTAIDDEFRKELLSQKK